MPVVRKLDLEEVQTIERKHTSLRKQREMEYDALVAEFHDGDYIEITPDAGETRMTIRHQVNKAAMRAGVSLEWMRGNGSVMKLKVVSSPFESLEDDADQPEDEEPEENGTAAALAEFELEAAPEPEPEPAPLPAPKKPARKPKVTERQAFVEAP